NGDLRRSHVDIGNSVTGTEYRVFRFVAHCVSFGINWCGFRDTWGFGVSFCGNHRGSENTGSIVTPCHYGSLSNQPKPNVRWLLAHTGGPGCFSLYFHKFFTTAVVRDVYEQVSNHSRGAVHA